MPVAFVTGAGGCVGRQLLDGLLTDGWEVTALLLAGEVERFAFRDNPRVTVTVGELNAVSDEAMPAGAVVFHLAAQVHSVPRTQAERERFFHVNRDGTAQLAEVARRRNASGFVFVSTIAVYGQALERGACDEQTPPQPDSPYGLSKLQAEQRLAQALTGQVPFVILRPCVIYGPGDRGNFARLIEAVRKGRFAVIDGGGARKNTLYVGNLARILIYFGTHVGQVDREVFNVADPEPMSMRQIAQTVADVLGSPVRFRSLPSGLLRPMAAVGDVVSILLGREMPLTRRRLRVMTHDSLVRTDKLHRQIAGQVELRPFRQGLREYLALASTPC